MKIHKVLMAGLLALCACSSDGGDEPSRDVTLTLSPTTLQFTAEKGTATIDVTCDAEWSVYASDAWLTVAKARDARSFDLAVAANATEQERKGSVTVKSGAVTRSVAVTQAGIEPEPVDPTIPAPEGYTLVWNDEFDGGPEPDTRKWSFETGGGGWGNNELQHYVRIYAPNGEQLATVEDGILAIDLKKIAGTVYSIRMNTTESWTYGYFEARLKLPAGRGTWPAFWMLPRNFRTWPGDGEIDIMEEVGYNPNYVSSSIHCQAYNHGIGTQKTQERLLPTAQTEFHTYALEWTATAITTYVDGKPLFSFPNDGKGNRDTWPFSDPFYLKLNLAWGGNWGGAMGVDEACLPARYEVDYVRVFQKK